MVTSNLLFDFIDQYMVLTEAEKQTLLGFDLFQTIKKGTVLLREGQYSEKGYFVLKGCLRTYYLVDGEEKTTAFYTEMEGLVPHCVPSKQPSAYFVAVVEEAIMVVSKPDMEAVLFQKFPRFETLCRIMSEQLLVKNQRSFDAFKTSSPEQRYLDLLENRPDLIQRVPQHQIASFLGIKPQSLSRLRARIAEKGR
jgi:CRP-like cAMP-binding protein